MTISGWSGLNFWSVPTVFSSVPAGFRSVPVLKNYRIQCIFKSTFTSLKLNRLTLQLEITCFQVVKRTNEHSENE